MTKQEIILANQQHLFPSVFHYYREPLVVTNAKDQYVWDIDGNQYLDFFGGIVTVSVGHCNDTVNQKVHEQMDRLQHVSTVFANEPQAALAKRIAEITPGGKLTKSFFTNSGTEANETAILTARCYTGNHEIVALRHSYHGRSAVAMAPPEMPPGAGRRRAFGLRPCDQRVLLSLSLRPRISLLQRAQCARDMEEMIRTSTSGRIAAFIAEPIQGVGGFHRAAEGIFRNRLRHREEIPAACSSATKCRPVGDAPAENGSASSNGASAGYHHQRERPRQRRAGGADCGASGSRRRNEGRDHLDFRRQPGDGDRGEGRDRLHRRKQADDQRRGDRRVSARASSKR
jgi:hypothetical protein